MGTWDIDSYCLVFNDPPVPGDVPECGDALKDYAIDTQGTLTFTADGMVTSSMTSQVRLELVISDACAQALGGTDVTQALCDGLESTYADNTAEYESANCTLLPGACQCSVVSQPSTSTETNAYSLDGDQILIGDSEASEYCVEGDELTLGVVVSDGSYSIAAHRAP